MSRNVGIGHFLMCLVEVIRIPVILTNFLVEHTRKLLRMCTSFAIAQTLGFGTFVLK